MPSKLPGKPKEREIQEACCNLLELDGWRRIRMDMPQLRGMGVQEPGMCDDLFLRYDFPTRDWPKHQFISMGSILWCEFKRPRGGVVSPKQKEWHAREKARGALIWCAMVDFDPTVEGFLAHYAKSGLMVRELNLKR